MGQNESNLTRDDDQETKTTSIGSALVESATLEPRNTGRPGRLRKVTSNRPRRAAIDGVTTSVGEGVRPDTPAGARNGDVSLSPAARDLAKRYGWSDEQAQELSMYL